jgi:hypothetical protein
VKAKLYDDLLACRPRYCAYPLRELSILHI